MKIKTSSTIFIVFIVSFTNLSKFWTKGIFYKKSQLFVHNFKFHPKTKDLIYNPFL